MKVTRLAQFFFVVLLVLSYHVDADGLKPKKVINAYPSCTSYIPDPTCAGEPKCYGPEIRYSYQCDSPKSNEKTLVICETNLGIPIIPQNELLRIEGCKPLLDVLGVSVLDAKGR